MREGAKKILRHSLDAKDIYCSSSSKLGTVAVVNSVPRVCPNCVRVLWRPSHCTPNIKKNKGKIKRQLLRRQYLYYCTSIASMFVLVKQAPLYKELQVSSKLGTVR